MLVHVWRCSLVWGLTVRYVRLSFSREAHLLCPILTWARAAVCPNRVVSIFIQTEPFTPWSMAEVIDYRSFNSANGL